MSWNCGTVLSNFALVDRIELLTDALGSQVATTPEVIDEFNDGVARGRLPEIQLDWLEVIDLEAEEKTLFQELLIWVNAGEAACLAVASQRNGRILTDDRDARKLAAQPPFPAKTTIASSKNSFDLTSAPAKHVPGHKKRRRNHRPGGVLGSD